MDSGALKQRHREVRDSQSTDLAVRIHRAISWLSRAEQETDDPDAHFIFLWISFNAAWASEFGFEQTAHDQVDDFIRHLLRLDSDKRLHGVLFEHFTGPVRTLVSNRYVFGPFWRAVRNHESDGAWKDGFEAGKKRAMYALMNNETHALLQIVLDRLYVLRNQLMHGGATWNSDTNREQVRDGTRILGMLVPIILELMLDADGDEFDTIAYPLV